MVSSVIREGKGKSIIAFPGQYIVIDLETTGLSPAFDKIIEFCGLKVKDGEVIETFTSLINPEQELDDYVQNLTGITNDMLRDLPTLEEVLPKIINFIGNDILLGHGASFDVNFLFDACQLHGGHIFANDFIDTLRIARRLHPELDHHRLCDLVDLFEIKTECFHRASADCLTTLECFKKLQSEALEKYGSEEEFAKAFAKKHSKNLNAKDITTEKTEFDTSHPLYGKVCVFTGVLEKMERKAAMQIVVDLGGECGNSVTKTTNFLILGNNDYCKNIKDGKSAKQKKAEAYKLKGCDIDIIPENVFYDLIND